MGGAPVAVVAKRQKELEWQGGPRAPSVQGQSRVTPVTLEQGFCGPGLLSGTIGSPSSPVLCGVFLLPHFSLVLF